MAPPPSPPRSSPTLSRCPSWPRAIWPFLWTQLLLATALCGSVGWYVLAQKPATPGVLYWIPISGGFVTGLSAGFSLCGRDLCVLEVLVPDSVLSVFWMLAAGEMVYLYELHPDGPFVVFAAAAGSLGILLLVKLAIAIVMHRRRACDKHHARETVDVETTHEKVPTIEDGP